MPKSSQIQVLVNDLQRFAQVVDQGSAIGRKFNILLLPPLSSELRFSVHQLVNDRFPELHTCSVGEGDARRVLILPRDLPVKTYTGKHANFYQLSKGSSSWKSDNTSNNTAVKPTMSSRNTVPGNPKEECSWDDLYFENGEPIDPKTLHAIVEAVGNVNILQSKNVDKNAVCPLNKEETLAAELLDGYEHILELSQFTSNLTTADLRAALRPLARNDLYEVIWVDDTRCLVVFETRSAAERTLLSDAAAKPFSIKGLQKASAKAREKVEKTLPKGAAGRKDRPATNASVARRLVTQALGVSTNLLSAETRARARSEHEKLKKARADKANKKQAAENAWEGKAP